MQIRRKPPSPKVRVSYLEYGVPLPDEKPQHILEEIVWAKDREIAIARERVTLAKLKEQVALLPAPLDFVGLARGFFAVFITSLSESLDSPERASFVHFDLEPVERGFFAVLFALVDLAPGFLLVGIDDSSSVSLKSSCDKIDGVSFPLFSPLALS